MSKLTVTFLAALALSSVVSAQVISSAPDQYQVRYFSNAPLGGTINITNNGVNAGVEPAGNICANVYVFDPAQELIACCACTITPNGLASLSTTTDLLSNTLTFAVPTSITVGIITTHGTTCNPSAVTPDELASGLRAWGTTLHALPTAPAGTYAMTETAFAPSDLSATELLRLTSTCGFIQADASGFGICNSCREGGGAGATKKQ